MVPQRFWVAAGQHLPCPTVALWVPLLTGCLASVAVLPLTHGVAVAPATVLVLLLAPPLSFLAVSGSGAMPAAMAEPINTPMGDMSVFVRLAWLLRGLLPAFVIAMGVLFRGLDSALWLLLPLLVLAIKNLRP